MANYICGTYTSIWDDGAVEISTPVVLDLDTMSFEFDGERVIVTDGDYDLDSIDDEIEILDDEFVEIESGERYTAVSEDYVDDAIDMYGNGIVVYGN